MAPREQEGWPEEIVVGRSGKLLMFLSARAEAEDFDTPHETYVPASLLAIERERRDGVEAEQRSLYCELATLLGPQKPRKDASRNEQWIAAVGQVLIERDQERELREELEGALRNLGQHLRDRADWAEAECNKTDRPLHVSAIYAEQMNWLREIAAALDRSNRKR